MHLAIFRFRYFLSCLIFSGVILSMSVNSFAAQPVPGPLVPGRQDKTFAEPPANARSTAAPSVRLTVEQMAPEQARNIKFTLKSITLAGARAIPSVELKQLWEASIGQSISVEQLYGITNRITQYYADKGYALSFAILPAQNITSGNVTIRVVEGFVDRAVIAGDIKPSLMHKIQGMANKITLEHPVRTATMERYLLLMNDIPGVTARATFAASEDVEEGSTMLVEIEHRAVNVQASIDNRLPKSLGRWDLSAAAAENGALNDTESLRIEQHCGIYCNLYNSTAVSVTRIMNPEGLLLGASINQSKDKPNTSTLKALSFMGQGTTVSLNASYPLIRTRQENLTLGVVASGSNLQTNTFAGVLTHDKTRTVGLQGIYDFADSTGGISLIGLDLVKGIPHLQATKESDPLKSHLNGTADFTLAKLHVLRNQPLGSFYSKLDGFSLYLQGAAQYSLDNPLLSASECTYGGTEIGRGYDNGSLSGDHCLMGSIELRRDVSIGRYMLQPYGFFDAARVWQRGILVAGERRSTGAQSTGVGARMSVSSHVMAGAEMAMPLRKPGSEDGKGDPRFFLSLTARY
jgi:hemolysin activation/secretion protein